MKTNAVATRGYQGFQMNRGLLVAACVGALLLPSAASAQGTSTGDRSGAGAVEGKGTNNQPAGMSGSNGMSRGTSGNSGAGAGKMGGSNAMSGSGKTGAAH